VLIALAGASFGWMRQATGSTRAAAIMHASYNALFFFVLFAQRRELAAHVVEETELPACYHLPEAAFVPFVRAT